MRQQLPHGCIVLKTRGIHARTDLSATAGPWWKKIHNGAARQHLTWKQMAISAAGVPPHYSEILSARYKVC